MKYEFNPLISVSSRRPAELVQFYLVQSLGGCTHLAVGGNMASEVPFCWEALQGQGHEGSTLCPESGVTVESTVWITRAQLFRKLTHSRSLKHSSEGRVNTSSGPLSCHDLLSLNRKYCVCDSLELPITVYPRDCHSQEYEKFALADLTDTSEI